MLHTHSACLVEPFAAPTGTGLHLTLSTLGLHLFEERAAASKAQRSTIMIGLRQDRLEGVAFSYS